MTPTSVTNTLSSAITAYQARYGHAPNRLRMGEGSLVGLTRWCQVFGYLPIGSGLVVRVLGMRVVLDHEAPDDGFLMDFEA